MSLANYTDLIATIASWTGRADISADIVGLFEAWANRKLRVRQQETLTTLTPSSGSVALPTDYLAWKRVTWAGSTNVGLEYVHPSWLYAAYPTTPSDTPKTFTIQGSTLYVMPVSDTSLTFLYYAKIPALATNSTNWLMTAHPDLYVSGCLHEAAAFMVDAEKAILWKAKRDEIYEEIKLLSRQTAAPSAIRVMGVVV